jgi:maleylpyruvate isomerase
VAGRTDRVTDPQLAAGLLLARRGQAFFSRKLNELADADFDGPSLLPGWTRAHVAAHVGLNARAITHLTEWAATGVETPMYSTPTEREDDIDFAATLPIQAIRNLSAHAAVHLNVEWRDLSDDAWRHEIRTAQGRIMPVSETVWMRTRETWVHAVDLDNGASVAQFPPELLDLLLADLIAVWRRKRAADGPNIRLEPSDRTTSFVIDPESEATVVTGTAADLVAWGIGRGPSRATTGDGGVPQSAPVWL